MAFDMSKIGVKKNIPSVNFTDYSGVFQAEGKFGKTTTASYFPNSVIIPFENGVKGAVANVVENINKWEDFIEFVDSLEENREEIGTDIRTIVFDTVNAGYELINPYVLKVASRIDGTVYKNVADMMGAKTNFWVERDRLFKLQIDRIMNMGFSILFLTHLQVKTIKPKKAEPYDVYKSTMSDRLEAMIYPLVDFILTGERKEVTTETGEVVRKRVLVTQATGMATAGGRVVIEKDIEFDTEKEAMEKYQEAFRNSVESKLREFGINDDIEDISKKQEKEKMEKVKEYIKTSSAIKEEVTPEYLKADIKELFGNVKDRNILKSDIEKAGLPLDYNKVTDIEVLKKWLDLVKKAQ